MRNEERNEREEERCERMVSSLLKDFKIFEYGEFLMEEFRRMLNKTEREFKQLLHNAKTAIEAVKNMMPKSAWNHKV